MATHSIPGVDGIKDHVLSLSYNERVNLLLYVAGTLASDDEGSVSMVNDVLTVRLDYTRG